MKSEPDMSHGYPVGSEDEAFGDIPSVPPDRMGLYSSTAEAHRDVLVLPDNLTIVEVGEFHAELGRWLNAGGSVAIDGNAVEMIDGAGLQLMTAFVRDMQQRADKVYWINPSDALARAAGRMGLHKALMLDHSLDVS